MTYTKAEILASLDTNGCRKTGPYTWEDETHSYRIRGRGDCWSVTATRLPGRTYSIREALLPYFIAARAKAGTW
jgi:hypothetical protein